MFDGGCSLWRDQKATSTIPGVAACRSATMVAKYTASPIKIDGKLDDAAWKTARVYKTSLSQDLAEAGKQLREGGEVRLAWDDQYFYVGVKFTDSDIVAEGLEDQMHHYQLGDVCELFLKPNDQTWYWEMYGTPLSKKTTFWFPGRGRLGLKSGYDGKSGLTVAAEVCGTLNNWQDRDQYWTVELAVPIKDLTARGEKFGPGSDWRILVARYNYSRYLSTEGPELSMTPRLSRSSYHLLEDYAKLCLEK